MCDMPRGQELQDWTICLRQWFSCTVATTFLPSDLQLRTLSIRLPYTPYHAAPGTRQTTKGTAKMPDVGEMLNFHGRTRELLNFPVKRFLRKGARTLLGAPGIATRNKEATRGSWPYY